MPHVLKKNRLEKQLAQRLSELVIFEIADAHLHNEIISITRVHLTNDFLRASVHFTLLNEANKNRVIKALYRSLPYMKRLLVKRIKIRQLPEFRFFYDHDPYQEKSPTLSRQKTSKF